MKSSNGFLPLSLYRVPTCHLCRCMLQGLFPLNIQNWVRFQGYTRMGNSILSGASPLFEPVENMMLPSEEPKLSTEVRGCRGASLLKLGPPPETDGAEGGGHGCHIEFHTLYLLQQLSKAMELRFQLLIMIF